MNSRIYIIGGLGSGKSFFAKKLSEKTGIEYFNMDRIIFKEGSFEERTDEERNLIFESIVKKNNWILEGTFTESWITPGLEEATHIVYLATPRLISLYRFIKRTAREGVFKQSGLFGRTVLVLGFKYKEWDRTADKYEEILRPHKNKVVTLKSEKEVRDFISTQ